MGKKTAMCKIYIYVKCGYSFFTLKSVYCIRIAHVYVRMNVECKVFHGWWRINYSQFPTKFPAIYGLQSNDRVNARMRSTCSVCLGIFSVVFGSAVLKININYIRMLYPFWHIDVFVQYIAINKAKRMLNKQVNRNERASARACKTRRRG